MTKAEKREIIDRTLAMDREQIKVMLSVVPDPLLLRAVIHKLSYLTDLADAYECVRGKVDKAYNDDDDYEDVYSWGK